MARDQKTQDEQETSVEESFMPENEVKKFRKIKVILRNDSAAPTVTYDESIIETDESYDELLKHAHIHKIIGEVTE